MKLSLAMKRSIPALILCLVATTACSGTSDQGPPPLVSTGGVTTGGHSHGGSLVSQPLTRYGGPVSVKMEVEPSAPQAGQQFTISYTLNEAGQPLTLNKLQITHERPMHLIVVSKDLQYFSHLHPEEKGNGRYAVTTTIPKPGPYLLFNEFVTEKGITQYDRHEIKVAGEAAQGDAGTEKLEPTLGHVQQVGELSTLLAADTVTVKRRVPTTFFLDVSKGGRPVMDLEPYLAAAGHIVIISADTTQFLHTHGEPHDPNVPHTHSATTHPLPPVRFGPQIEFTHTFNTQPGLYKIWVQFIYGGKVVTVENTVEVLK